MLYSKPEVMRWLFVKDQKNNIFRVIKREVHGFSTRLLLENGDDVNDADYTYVKQIFAFHKPKIGESFRGALINEDSVIATSPVEKILKKEFDWKKRTRYYLFRTKSGSIYSAEVAK